MSSDHPIIEVENLGKLYRLGAGQKNERYTALRDVIASKARRLLPHRRKPDAASVASADPQEFWALKDISFSVHPGEVVGIIGRNGAGKSTLLKVLSRITEPTQGRVTLRGRVASLLEVGTGFHPELTGRENVFLNGAILGMARTEIKSKFDEIVAFAEVERFLDTPVKRYSSGMYVRLAFAVAAHLEPEILIVDEVLAVGDAEFQKKCLGKMESVAKGQGRTVLFVSHQMNAVQTLCTRAIVLNRGQVQLIGSAHEAVQAYLGQSAATDHFERAASPSPDGKPRLLSATLRWQNAADLDSPPTLALLDLEVHAGAARTVALDLRLQDAAGLPVGFGSLGTLDESTMLPLRVGRNRLTICLPTDNLANGSYTVSLDLGVPYRERFDRVEQCLSFDLERPDGAIGKRGVNQQWGYGSVRLLVALESNGGLPSSHELT